MEKLTGKVQGNSEEKIDRRKFLNYLVWGGVAAGLGGYAVYEIGKINVKEKERERQELLEKQKVAEKRKIIIEEKGKIIIDTSSGEISSAYVEAPFDEGKEILEKEGYEIISLEENARLRMQEGYNSDFCKRGNWVREAVIYVPKKGKFLTKNSPIMENAKEATDCHRKGIEYYLTDEQVEKALENAVEIKNTEIPTNRFKDDELTVFAFGECAEAYGNFLKDSGIIKVYIGVKDIKDKSSAGQINILGIATRSELVSYWDLGFDDIIRGILKSQDESITKPFPYTPGIN